MKNEEEQEMNDYDNDRELVPTVFVEKKPTLYELLNPVLFFSGGIIFTLLLLWGIWAFWGKWQARVIVAQTGMDLTLPVPVGVEDSPVFILSKICVGRLCYSERREIERTVVDFTDVLLDDLRRDSEEANKMKNQAGGAAIVQTPESAPVSPAPVPQPPTTQGIVPPGFLQPTVNGGDAPSSAQEQTPTFSEMDTILRDLKNF